MEDSPEDDVDNNADDVNVVLSCSDVETNFASTGVLKYWR